MSTAHGSRSAVERHQQSWLAIAPGDRPERFVPGPGCNERSVSRRRDLRDAMRSYTRGWGAGFAIKETAAAITRVHVHTRGEGSGRRALHGLAAGPLISHYIFAAGFSPTRHSYASAFLSMKLTSDACVEKWSVLTRHHAQKERISRAILQYGLCV